MIYTKEIVKGLYENKQFANVLTNLYTRWLDECKYEDINEYGKVLKSTIEEVLGCAVSIKMSKRPFGVKLVGKYLFGGTDALNADIMISRTLRDYAWSAKPKKK